MGPRNRLVLLVEDEATLRRIVARNLEMRGARVREAATAAEAIAAVVVERPDLMLLDIDLPDRTGWDVFRELKRQGIDVPTVVVSAVRVSQVRLAEFCPIAYLPKPFAIEALLRLVFGDRRPGTPTGPAVSSPGLGEVDSRGKLFGITAEPCDSDGRRRDGLAR